MGVELASYVLLLNLIAPTFITPFRNWPLPMIPIETEPDDVLLVGDEPSEVCYELAIQAADVEAELINLL
jgi:hypothetical protein